MIQIVGTVRIPAGSIDAARPAMERMLTASRNEPGCLRYSYAIDVLDEGLVHVVEAWADRDALAAKLDQQRTGAWMVNNAQVEALRGKKQKLTVKARNTREMRLAFDLPKDLASLANFRIVSPSGKTYQGNDPAISMSFEAPDGEATASLSLIMGGPGSEQPARVHLRFEPKEKLEPGVYTIDVRSGETYLNTVRLSLR